MHKSVLVTTGIIVKNKFSSSALNLLKPLDVTGQMGSPDLRAIRELQTTSERYNCFLVDTAE